MLSTSWMPSKRSRARGFTLIELLIVVAIIGIIAVILIPSLLDALQKAKQKRTVADIKLVGTAWFSWVTDQVSAASAGQTQIDWTTLTATSHSNVASLLVPQYTAELPVNDGWRRPFEFAQDSSLFTLTPIAIRSPGADGLYQSGPYTVGPFVSTDYNQDILWVGGYFAHYPENVK